MFRSTVAAMLVASLLPAQPPVQQQEPPPPKFRSSPGQQQPGQVAEPQSEKPPYVPLTGQVPTSTAPAAGAPGSSAGGGQYSGLTLQNASLTEVIDLLARDLKINYILDPRVKGSVILNTYGEAKNIDTRSLLETVLRINGYAIVKTGDIHRIVPMTDALHQQRHRHRLALPFPSR